MMGATFPTMPIEPDPRRHTSDAMKYVRFEYGEGNPTWLVKELDGGSLEDSNPKRSYPRRFIFSLRALAAKVAAVLF